MIPSILCIVGILLLVFSFFFLAAILLQPVIKTYQVVLKRNDDYIFFERGIGKKLYKHEKENLMAYIISGFIIGGICLFFGLYLGHAERGSEFWLYNWIFEDNSKIIKSDRITDDGKYIAEDGKEYSCYVFIEKDTIFFNGDECTDINDLENMLTNVPMGNRVVIVDRYAIASVFHQVENLLKQHGILYEMSIE